MKMSKGVQVFDGQGEVPPWDMDADQVGEIGALVKHNDKLLSTCSLIPYRDMPSPIVDAILRMNETLKDFYQTLSEDTMMAGSVVVPDAGYCDGDFVKNAYASLMDFLEIASREWNGDPARISKDSHLRYAAKVMFILEKRIRVLGMKLRPQYVDDRFQRFLEVVL